MTATITKERIATMLKSKIGLSTIICEEIINHIFVNILEISKTQKLTISSFGSFCTVIKKARPGRNFHTKTKLVISSKKILRFTPSKKLKLLINKKIYE